MSEHRYRAVGAANRWRACRLVGWDGSAPEVIDEWSGAARTLGPSYEVQFQAVTGPRGGKSWLPLPTPETTDQ